MTTSEVVRRLTAWRIPHALVGGHAATIRGISPAMDLEMDFLAADSLVLEKTFWGSSDVDLRKGENDDPVDGVALIQIEDGVCCRVVVPKDGAVHAVILRAELMNLDGFNVAVAQASDLDLAAELFGERIGYVRPQSP